MAAGPGRSVKLKRRFHSYRLAPGDGTVTAGVATVWRCWSGHAPAAAYESRGFSESGIPAVSQPSQMVGCGQSGSGGLIHMGRSLAVLEGACPAAAGSGSGGSGGGGGMRDAGAIGSPQSPFAHSANTVFMSPSAGSTSVHSDPVRGHPTTGGPVQRPRLSQPSARDSTVGVDSVCLTW